ncbi:hypothetical protein B2I21_11865 [Chryseobacterium mucoviscidosis]|nr:hypothetical protein B2I21_11865 [Chryseobacterium mucoviscidosis]
MFSDMILYRLSYGDNGYTLEEMKMVRETKKIMGTLCWDEQLPVPTFLSSKGQSCLQTIRSGKRDECTGNVCVMISITTAAFIWGWLHKIFKEERHEMPYKLLKLSHRNAP